MRTRASFVSTHPINDPITHGRFTLITVTPPLGALSHCTRVKWPDTPDGQGTASVAWSSSMLVLCSAVIRQIQFILDDDV